ncbi:MAG: alternative ribosome rescue aminoacyl-tRNA hydrolase ArfB [Gemmatimonadota bacterium]
MPDEISTRTALQVTRSLSIPLAELRFTFDRSPGPGGQNVNKVNTRAELRFDVATSPSLSESQRQRLRAGLASRLVGDGVLVVRSSRHRTQLRNRQDCLDKLSELMAAALRPPPPKRRPTGPSRAARARRLDGKRRHAGKKQDRQRPPLD